MAIASKRTRNGFIEIRNASTAGWYALYVNGQLVSQSADLNYIKAQYRMY